MIAPNNRLTEFSWVGKEVSKDLHNLYVYFEVLNCNKNGTIEAMHLENSIFTDLLPNQANIVLVEFDEEKFNLTFTKEAVKHKVKLK
jgi:hypothetical protein